MVWSIDSETGALTDVLLCPPDHYEWIKTNAIAVETLRSGRRIDTQQLRSQFRQLEDALDQGGVRRHYVEPEPHLPYQVYTRDSESDHAVGTGVDAARLAGQARRGGLDLKVSRPERRLLAVLQPRRH